MKALGDYQGKLALVTGAGDGIGASLARNLASAGLRVCVVDIRAEAAERVAAGIGEAAFALQADVSDRDSLARAAGALEQRGETVNLVWINAGVGVGSPVMTGKPETIEWAFSVNVLGVIWTAQAFRPLMETASGPRHFGVTASTAALQAPSGAFPLYAATKHGTLAIAEALRAEAARDGIGTTILCPGLLDTEIWDGAKARPERFGGERRMDPAIAARWRAAPHPDAMWPHIARSIDAGGGFLVYETEPETKAAFSERFDDISAGFITHEPER